MILEDLQYIFKDQIIIEENLYYMLIDGDHKEVCRHEVNKLEELLPMLSCFEYRGSQGDIPRFVK